MHQISSNFASRTAKLNTRITVEYWKNVTIKCSKNFTSQNRKIKTQQKYSVLQYVAH